VNLQDFQILESAPIREALAQITKNQHGLVLTVNLGGVVTGLATDGDIRDRLIKDVSLEDPVSICANHDFIWADEQTPREMLLKQLDRSIRVIPVLDGDKKLKAIVSREYLPVQVQERTYVRARAPVRISFGGGGSDLTHFFEGERGAVINTTISIYSHATLRLRDDARVYIYSRDLDAVLEATDLKNALAQKGPFGLIQALLRVVHPDFGFELYVHSDFPIKSGLGGSATVSASILGCFNELRQDKWDSHELAELAFQAERLYLGIAGGWQDQYASVFGGFNFMEFRMDQNIVHPLRVSPDILRELEESLVLCDTGLSHDSGEIHQDQRAQMQQSAVRDQVKTNVELTYKIRNHLLRGQLLSFGEALHEAWLTKRQFSQKISNSRLDELYENARRHGAIGGKLLGAGGGGFFLFYVSPFRKYELTSYLVNQGLSIRPFRFELEGLCTWSVREGRNHKDEVSP
jgi:D-glycero-alpha-D-manno-heptose-7-phosphate kinase